MYRKPQPFFLSVPVLLLLVPACGNSDNNVGTIPSSGGSGGNAGSGGVTGGWAGPDCVGPDGKKVPVGASYTQDCKQCTCEIITLEPLTSDFRCAYLVCPEASVGSGGAGGSTGTGYCTDRSGKTYAVGESFQQECNTCWCDLRRDGVGTVITCTMKGCSVDADVVWPAADAAVPTGGTLGTGGISGTGGTPWPPPIDAPLGNGGAGGGGSGGSSMGGGGDSGSTDTAEYCSYNGRTYRFGVTFRATDGCNECWCASPGGQAVATCTLLACGDAGWPNFFQPSKCLACASNELCVAYYDGTCKPMQSTCREVSATTRQSILVDHQSCFAKPTGDEICGTQNGGHFWGCGAPPCPNEPLLSDVNCYGP
jgi:hypothetical protein